MLPQDWGQPIETAPKDQKLLLLDGGEFTVGYWFSGREWGRDSPISEFWTTGPEPARGGYDCGMTRISPTRWWSLPTQQNTPE